MMIDESFDSFPSNNSFLIAFLTNFLCLVRKRDRKRRIYNKKMLKICYANLRSKNRMDWCGRKGMKNYCYDGLLCEVMELLKNTRYEQKKML